MNRILASIFGLLLVIVATPVFSQSQPVRPIFTTTSLDGQLIGFELVDVQFGIWEPIVALAFGKNDKGIRIRYRGGMTIASGIEIPILKQFFGDFGAAIVNWPSSPILGREGQTGLELGLKLGETEYKGFIGELWPLGSDDFFTPVAFFSSDAFYSASLPYGITLSGSTQTVAGMVLPQKESGIDSSIKSLFEQLSMEKVDWPFRSTKFSAGVGLNGFRVSGQWGLLSNEAALDSFEFVTGVRGISQSLRGDSYWNVTLSRNFTMYETSIPLDLPEQFSDVPLIPTELPVKLAGRLFFQGGAVINELEPPAEETEPSPDVPEEAQQIDENSKPILESEMLFSWGISTTLTIYELNIRADLVFTQDGETKFSFSF
jgi:hypothetical protein